MAFFENRTPTDLHSAYGYRDRSASIDLDQVAESAAEHLARPLNRVFEVLTKATQDPRDYALPSITKEQVDYFNLVAKTAFREIGLARSWSPVLMWHHTKLHLVGQGVTNDEIDDIEKFCLGWKNFTGPELERYLVRYNYECVLVNALFDLYQEHEELNELREIIAEKKRKERTLRQNTLQILIAPRPTTYGQQS